MGFLYFIDAISLHLWRRNSIATMSAAASAPATAQKVIFGADWCPHTQNAVSALGGKFVVQGGAFSKKGAQKVKYINCADKANAAKCKAHNIKGYPTFMTCTGSKCQAADLST